MAARLKSILKPIPWSLALRAAVFGAAWFLLPFWLFLLAAAYLYFKPLFRPSELALPFIAVIFFAAIEPRDPLLAVFFAVLFYFILGIKDLIFIGRKPAYEVLVLLLAFLLFVKFFERFDSWSGRRPFFFAALTGGAAYFLARGFFRYVVPAAGTGILPGRGPASAKPALLSLLFGIVVWQGALILLFLPLNFLYQAAILFLLAAIMLETFLDYSEGTLTPRKLLAKFSVFLAIVVTIFCAASWTP